MERIDKIIASQGLYSRSDVKYLVKHKRVAVDGEAVTSSSRKADPEASVITIDGKPLIFKKQVYLMLHKPQGYVSATEDKTQPTVLALVPQAYKGRELFPAGRLDKDTTGLMILTDDGVLAHNILSPRKHVQKVYRVELDIPVTKEMQEGRYHQIKRMFGCFGAKVVSLHRLAMGNLYLPADLPEGACRELTAEELNQLQMRES